MSTESESMQYDVVIVGGGPAGLSAAIKLMQLSAASNRNLRVCLLEKGAQIGAHLLSGAVLCPRSLQALLPETWATAPLDTPVTHDAFYYLTKRHALRLPTPKPMKNEGNYIISLGQLCRFLEEQAQQLGCEIYTGFAASELLYNEDNQVIGVKTGEMGIDKQGKKSTHYQAGMNILGKQTLFAEGCRGELSQQLIARYQLRKNKSPQTYGLGIKEIWRIKPEHHRLGHVIHTVGWPMDYKTYGGSFIYHLSEERVSLGFVVGLDYENPWLSPFSEMQRFKTHPMVSKLLEGGERISYGARALSEGGYQSLPELVFPGGMLIGDAAGFLNVAEIKGIHRAMQSGMLAAEACFPRLSEDKPLIISDYPKAVHSSWLGQELYQVRNIRPGFATRFGLWFGLANAAFETYISKGHSPWTLKNHFDHEQLKPAAKMKPIHYPKPDGKLTFDRLSSVYLSNTYHEENQPSHLVFKVPSVAITVNLKQYASPETRYCPAGVYEIINADKNPQMQINAQNCIHCKTCDIKDPTQSIRWQAPEGGGGPNYVDM